MDTVQAFNLNAITTGKRDKINKETEFIKEGAFPCEITGVETSESRDDYNGAPYIHFNVKSGSKIGRAKFWAVRESDKPSTKEWKAKQLKEFLVNCGVTDFSDDTTAIQKAVGCKVNIAFIYEEYIGYEKDSGKPAIRRAIKYRWSSKDGAKITYADNMNQSLSREDSERFSIESTEFNGKEKVESTDSDDLPF